MVLDQRGGIALNIECCILVEFLNSAMLVGKYRACIRTTDPEVDQMSQGIVVPHVFEKVK